MARIQAAHGAIGRQHNRRACAGCAGGAHGDGLGVQD